MQGFTGISLVLSTLCILESAGQRRPPNYSQDKMPVTSFSCRDKILGGYYSDPETDCQMFHVCVKVPGIGVQDYKFLCPNDTAFDQENQNCDDWYNIDCEASTLYYSDNFDLYRIGSDVGGKIVKATPRLPNNNINNAVSEVNDDDYLQRSDRGENVGSDLLRGSHSSNFYANKNRGKENHDYQEEKKKKPTNSNKNVRKLLTGKRPVASTTQAPYQTYQSTVQAQQQRTNLAGRNRVTSNFNRYNQPTEATARLTENYNGNQRQNQRTAPVNTQTEFYKTQTSQKQVYNPTTQNQAYNPTTQRQVYNPTTQNQVYNPTTQRQVYNPTTQKQQVYNPTTLRPTGFENKAYQTNSNYETQKLFKINTAGFYNQQNQQYDEPSNGEFLKTAPSQNLGASNFNRVQNAYNKSFNTSVASSYNFVGQSTTVKPTTYQKSNSKFFNPSTAFNANPKPIYSSEKSTTQKPIDKNKFYSPTTSVKPFSHNQQFYSPSTQQPFNQNQQFSISTQKSVVSNQQFYNPSTQKSVVSNQQFYNPSTTQKPFSQSQTFYNPSTTQKPQNQQFFNPSTTVKPLSQNSYNPSTQSQQFYNPSTTQKAQQFYNPSTTQQPFNNQQFYNPSTVAPKQQFYNPSTVQQNQQFFNPTTLKPYQQSPSQTFYIPKKESKLSKQRGSVTYAETDATEKPRPFTTQPVTPSSQPEKKEKEQYDYAYYDDAVHSDYDNVETVEFSRTRSKKQ